MEPEVDEGQTPLDEEEKEGLLIAGLHTRAELNEFEQQNIEKGIEWTLRRNFRKEQVLSEGFVLELHKKMFGEVWLWAGRFRKSEKNLGIKWKDIPVQLKQLNGDCSLWIERKTYKEEEIAIRYKHRLVSIHCFSNGNGRHSRLMADVIISHIFNKPVFSWGSNDDDGPRKKYLEALKQADKGEMSALVKFARS